MPLVVEVFLDVVMMVVVMHELRHEPVRGRRRWWRRVTVQRHQRHGPAVLNARHVVALLLMHQLRFWTSHRLRDRSLRLGSWRHTRSTPVQVAVVIVVVVAVANGDAVARRIQRLVFARCESDEGYAFVDKRLRQCERLLSSVFSNDRRRCCWRRTTRRINLSFVVNIWSNETVVAAVTATARPRMPMQHRCIVGGHIETTWLLIALLIVNAVRWRCLRGWRERWPGSSVRRRGRGRRWWQQLAWLLWRELWWRRV